ncbi:methyl-accepting chemotaxis protein [Salmonella enterica]|uniref:Methyl-accepting chemotaxis protein n=1 Tax=Salmonella enterica TaxID=28901 RepID=A0A3R0Q3Y3_SALER|nr:HAMP domain-containing protein [Salmonella enterica]EBH8099967.1 HAMP domain-containing protein [Salmonella enterica subsp. houtenae serovar O:11:g,z25:-]EEJ1557665.1 HAMP domain-containing protein [Salmonella enterica subsp. houtenae]EAY4740022.1 HAMP domain-containing protein [Salmonella enterica]EAZ9461280.1 HAMP domain-containing protein [Salmonella enterica]
MPKILSLRASLLALLSSLTLLLLLTGSMGLYASARVITSWAYYGVMSVATLVALGLLWVMWLMLRNKLLYPLGNVVEQLERLAAGDLTPVGYQPACAEFNRLNTAMADMRAALSNSVRRVRDASSQIDIGSRELTAGNIHLATRTESTATSLEQTAVSMEELTATVKQNAENAEQAHQLAKTVSDTADRGSEMVCYVIEKMRDISGSSNRIADILSVIDGIAFQTNILALNASVEAARAGEQGRGFAVVAGEVRNLASRSAEAAKEIRTLISASHSHVREGSDLALQAGETMDEIANEVMRMTRLMREIASASQEQSRGIEQVNIAVSQMDETAQQNAALVQQSSAATRSLEEQSHTLLEVMAVFKLQTA